jgi:hypothetical protein
MPSVSEKQRRFMGAELARKRAGKKTKTKMSEEQLSEFASTKKLKGKKGRKKGLKNKKSGWQKAFEESK